jgi:hypothetical protein
MQVADVELLRRPARATHLDATLIHGGEKRRRDRPLKLRRESRDRLTPDQDVEAVRLTPTDQIDGPQVLVEEPGLEHQ